MAPSPPPPAWDTSLSTTAIRVDGSGHIGRRLTAYPRDVAPSGPDRGKISRWVGRWRNASPSLGDRSSGMPSSTPCAGLCASSAGWCRWQRASRGCSPWRRSRRRQPRRMLWRLRRRTRTSRSRNPIDHLRVEASVLSNGLRNGRGRRRDVGSARDRVHRGIARQDPGGVAERRQRAAERHRLPSPRPTGPTGSESGEPTAPTGPTESGEPTAPTGPTGPVETPPRSPRSHRPSRPPNRPRPGVQDRAR